METRFPIALRARALSAFMNTAGIPPERIVGTFNNRWAKGCTFQIELLFAALWNHPRDAAAARRIVIQAYAQLRTLEARYMLNSVRALREKHVRDLVLEWNRQQLAPGTIRTRLHELGDFTDWFGKRHVVENVVKALAARRKAVGAVDVASVD